MLKKVCLVAAAGVGLSMLAAPAMASAETGELNTPIVLTDGGGTLLHDGCGSSLLLGLDGLGCGLGSLMGGIHIGISTASWLIAECID